MAVDSWLARAVGVPWRAGGDLPETGWDCWGCAVWCLREGFGIDLGSPVRALVPHTEYIRARAPGSASGGARAVCVGMVCPALCTAPSPAPGVLVLLRLTGLGACHVGLMLDGDRFLHAQPKASTVVEAISHPRWASRLAGFYLPEFA